MSYFDRREDESIRYCAVCERRTMHTRPTPVGLWTCKDSGHPHPTKEQQDRGMTTNDNYESAIRHAVRIELYREHEEDRQENLQTREELLANVKGHWCDFAIYPSNMRILEVIGQMTSEGTLGLVHRCSLECFDEDRANAEIDKDPEVTNMRPGFCETPCTSYVWATKLVNPFCWCEAKTPCAPGECPESPQPGKLSRQDWAPHGPECRLRVDRRGYSPRQTHEEYAAFYEDREVLPKYDPESRTYIRDDLPPLFECGCSRMKVLSGKCDLYGPDGRERGWMNPDSAVMVGTDGQSAALANNRYGDKGTE